MARRHLTQRPFDGLNRKVRVARIEAIHQAALRAGGAL